MPRSSKTNSLAGLFLLAFLSAPLAADQAFWEKVLPKTSSPTDSYKFYIYQFRKNGGKFTTGSVYHMTTDTFRDRAVSTAVKWQNEGMIVGMVWSINGNVSESDARKKILEAYEKTFKTSLRPELTNSASLVGTSWSGYDHPTGDRFSLYLGSGGRATFNYGRRSVTLRWQQSGDQFNVEHLGRGWQNATVNGSKMTTMLRGVPHWTLKRR